MQDDGSDKQANSSAVSTVVGLVLGMILYMFLMIYGAMVMQSVIEEKNTGCSKWSSLRSAPSG